jgi:peroxiredoxin
MALPSLLKRRAMAMRMQAIKAELAARTLYVVDGEDIVMYVQYPMSHFAVN